MRLFALLTLLASVGLADTAKTANGTVSGTVEEGIAIYRGIPFAAPPVGDLRWRAPQPASNWKDVRSADKYAAPCVQGNGGAAKGKGTPSSEDCLYLNVWTPAKSSSERLPVMVWIYGGGFTGGSTSAPSQTGEQLAKKGVVVVAVAYRVGAMGFLAHPALSAESKDHVSGNYGMLDMVAGLQWVQKNIAGFGGNPGKVTIFGESAGGIAVSQLCASPLTKGLFHGAISESGGSFGPTRLPTMPGENMMTLKNAERLGEAYAAKAGASLIADLRKLSPDQVQAAAAGSQGVGWPIVDGHVIPDDQYKLYQAKRFNDTPILVGYNSDEGLSFGVPATPDAYRQATRQRYGPYADRLLAAYPTDPDKVTKTARDLTRDAAFGWQTWSWARLQTKEGKNKAYLYYFDQHPDYPADSPQAGRGSAHGSEIVYVFQHLRPGATKSDEAIAELMATYWTNFAKKGDPNGPGVPAWPAYDDSNAKSMYFSQDAHVGPVPSLSAMKTLDEYFTWRRTPEGAQFGASGGKLP
ncbi:MAG: carboxylesterase family protein [Bryobacteraceae bacterium]